MKRINPQRLPAFMLSVGLVLALHSSIIGYASAQTELCACSPRVYELTFDFSLECEPINLDLETGGILDAACLVTGFDEIKVTDLVPVAVASVQLIEIGQDEGPASVAQEKGDFRDGSTVTYTSISFDGEVVPRAFQVRALGRNQAGEPLVLQWTVTYSNDCGVWPVLEINDSIGWTIFTGLADPIALVCPAAPEPPLPNQPPVAMCKATLILPADSNCQSQVEVQELVDDGSFDPDGTGINFSLFPLGPYQPGETVVALTTTDADGATDSCTSVIIVEDMEKLDAANLELNHDGLMNPQDTLSQPSGAETSRTPEVITDPESGGTAKSSLTVPFVCLFTLVTSLAINSTDAEVPTETTPQFQPVKSTDIVEVLEAAMLNCSLLPLVVELTALLPGSA